MFEAAFGTPEVTFDRIKMAIAQFVRTLVSSNSKFDRWLRGEEQLSNDELAGYILFTTEEGADCFHCHGGGGNALMTTNLFYNNGKDTVFNDPRDRYAVTLNASDHGAYRAPSLRNIALTGPYMHDGRFKTLDEVIEFYSSQLVISPYVNPLMHKVNQGGAMLTPIEKAQLKAFLLALTDEDFITNPAYSKPTELP
jgi:cytochrome c peroxidase